MEKIAAAGAEELVLKVLKDASGAEGALPDGNSWSVSS